MQIKDFSKIKSISFKDSDILDKDAEQKVIELFNEINRTKERLHSLRNQVRIEEANVGILEKRLDVIMPLIDNIEYETSEKEDIRGETDLYFNFDSDINKRLY